jgi:hypothetical protein
MEERHLMAKWDCSFANAPLLKHLDSLDKHSSVFEDFLHAQHFSEHSVNLQGTFSENSVNIQYIDYLNSDPTTTAPTEVAGSMG